jgi:hypothetical protein
MDPYAVLRWGGQAVATAVARNGGCSPVWHRPGTYLTFEPRAPLAAAGNLALQVLDRAMLGGVDQEIGATVLEPARLAEGVGLPRNPVSGAVTLYDGWLQLQHDGEPAGAISVEVMAEPCVSQAANARALPGGRADFELRRQPPNRSFGLSVDSTCRVLSVLPGSSAAAAGVRVESTVLAVDSRPVADKGALLRALDGCAAETAWFTLALPPAEVEVVSVAEVARLRTIVEQFRPVILSAEPPAPPAPRAASLLQLLTAEERAVCEDCAGFAAVDWAAEEPQQVATDCRIACQCAFAWCGGPGCPAASAAMTAVTAALGLRPKEAEYFMEPAAWVELGATWGSPPLVMAQRRWTVLWCLLVALTAGGAFDARHRTLLRTLAGRYGLAWGKVRAAEVLRLAQMAAAARKAAGESNTEGSGEEHRADDWGRNLKIGAAGLVGGAALFFTGGLAAPAVAGAFGLLGAGGLLAAAGGATFVATVFGAAGAGLGATTQTRRPHPSNPSAVPP